MKTLLILAVLWLSTTTVATIWTALAIVQSEEINANARGEMRGLDIYRKSAYESAVSAYRKDLLDIAFSRDEKLRAEYEEAKSFGGWERRSEIAEEVLRQFPAHNAWAPYALESETKIEEMYGNAYAADDRADRAKNTQKPCIRLWILWGLVSIIPLTASAHRLAAQNLLPPRLYWSSVGGMVGALGGIAIGPLFAGLIKSTDYHEFMTEQKTFGPMSRFFGHPVTLGIIGAIIGTSAALLLPSRKRTVIVGETAKPVNE